MKVDKKVIATLPKCYAMSEVTVEGKHCFVAAAEKEQSWRPSGPKWAAS